MQKMPTSGTREIFAGSDTFRVRAEVLPGFVRLTCENLVASPLTISLAMAGQGIAPLTPLPAISLQGWGERAIVVAYTAPREALLEVVGIACENGDTLLARASLAVPKASLDDFREWTTWARVVSWLSRSPVDLPGKEADIARLLSVHGNTLPVEALPGEFDIACSCPAIPAIVAAGPAGCELYCAEPTTGTRLTGIASGEVGSQRRALVQVGIAIAKVTDLIDINWEIGDILTILGDIGRLLPQAGVPASTVTPLVQILANIPGRTVTDLPKPTLAALSQGLARLERAVAEGADGIDNGVGS